MNPLSRTLATLASAVGFHGFDDIHLAALKPGKATARDVRERLGAPTAEWPNSDGSMTWEYPRGPEGTHCWMLTLNERGALQKIEQALTEENFARIETGWSAKQVRRLLGKPAGEAEFPLRPAVVWEWRIDPAFSGNRAFFHVHFSLNGYVTATSRREESPA
ncbi:MAG: hypothetical protein D4R84_15060 [Rhodocyclaceae bacterium]|nr:MAG: hypothetical protein D4R84_15060 [Rhodocyclaceae bacterium]